MPQVTNSLLRVKGCVLITSFSGIEEKKGGRHCNHLGASQTTLSSLKLSPMYECSVTKSCPTLCNPMDCSPPGSSIHRVSQSRIPEWVAISFSTGSCQSRDQTHVVSWVSCVGLRFLYQLSHGKSSEFFHKVSVCFLAADFTYMTISLEMVKVLLCIGNTNTLQEFK